MNAAEQGDTGLDQYGDAQWKARVGGMMRAFNQQEDAMLSTILLIVLILILIGALPTWGHSRSWGYAPSGITGLLVIVLIVLLLTGRI